MMTKLKLLSAAAVLSAAIATPALAQEVIYNPGYCAQFYPNANCQNKGPNNPYTGSYQRRAAYQNNTGYWDNGWNNSWNNNWNNGWNDNRGFWPGDVAAGVVGGGAVGTAGAVARPRRSAVIATIIPMRIWKATPRPIARNAIVRTTPRQAPISAATAGVMCASDDMT
jgi:hypothetical protein